MKGASRIARMVAKASKHNRFMPIQRKASKAPLGSRDGREGD